MNRSAEVEAWLEAYDNPMKDVVRRVREIIIHSDHRIVERVDGESPTFSYRGNLVSIFPHSKKHASLMFERGAEIPGHHPRLEGEGDTGRVMKIASMAEANAAKEDLQHLVRSWCDWRDAERAEGEEVETRTAKKTAARKARPAAEKARKPAAKKARRPPAKKARRPAGKKARKPAAKKAGRPAAKKARRPAGKKATKRATKKARGPRGS
jgi:hypothetical protein